MRTLTGLFLGLLTVGLPLRAENIKTSPNLIVNGGFEKGAEVHTGFLPLQKGSEAIPGWEVTRGPIDLIHGYWKSARGERSVDLNGSPGAGGVKQTIATKKGSRYRVSFRLAGNPGGPAEKEVIVEAGETKRSFTFDSTGKTREEMGWIAFDFDFTATAEKTDIEFFSNVPAAEDSGPAIDDVCVRVLR